MNATRQIPTVKPAPCNAIRVRGALGQYPAPADRPLALLSLWMQAEGYHPTATAEAIEHVGRHGSAGACESIDPEDRPIADDILAAAGYAPACSLDFGHLFEFDGPTDDDRIAYLRGLTFSCDEWNALIEQAATEAHYRELAERG